MTGRIDSHCHYWALQRGDGLDEPERAAILGGAAARFHSIEGGRA